MARPTKTGKQKSRANRAFVPQRFTGDLNAHSAGLCMRPPVTPAKQAGKPGRWVRHAGDEYAIKQGCYFDERQAAYVVEWFRRHLRHSIGAWAGKPFDPLPWQIELLEGLFGWHTKQGTRRIKKAYVEISKKNGKSTFAAGLGLYMACGDGEPSPEIYSTATDQKQATIVHKEAIRMVEASPDLFKYFDINRSTNAIFNHDDHAEYTALANNYRGVQGINPHCIIADEIHSWRGREFYEAIEYASAADAARKNALFFGITTAGDDTESVCYDLNQHAKAVLSGKIRDDRFLPAIYSVDPDDRLDLVGTWKKANPSMGVTMTSKQFRKDYIVAKASPRAFASFKRYRLNVWHTGTDAWLDKFLWEKAERKYTGGELQGLPCWAGLDLARKADLSAFVLTFRDGETYYLLPHFWLPQAQADRMDGLVKYKDWAAAGLLTLTPGDVADFAAIRSDIIGLIETYQPEALAYDPWHAEETTQVITDETGVERMEFRQTIGNFAGPTQALERMIESGELVHNGHDLLDWQAGNVEVYEDPNGNMRPIKQKKGSHKTIDGMVAAIMSLALAIGREELAPSHYETAGLEMG